jgi:hypothetical protein
VKEVVLPRHVLGDAGPPNVDAELEQLAVNPRRPHNGLATLI